MGQATLEGERASLLQQIAQLEAELHQARTELRALDERLLQTKVSKPITPFTAPSIHRVHAQSTPAEKLALFLERFAGRTDVYANRC